MAWGSLQICPTAAAGSFLKYDYVNSHRLPFIKVAALQGDLLQAACHWSSWPPAFNSPVTVTPLARLALSCSALSFLALSFLRQASMPDCTDLTETSIEC